MIESTLETKIKFILKQAGVKPEDFDRCMNWAFGHSPWSLSPSEWRVRWNTLHPQAFQIDKDDKFVEVVYVVGYTFVHKKMKDSINNTTLNEV